jgi:hypothetical protein
VVQPSRSDGPTVARPFKPGLAHRVAARRDSLSPRLVPALKRRPTIRFMSDHYVPGQHVLRLSPDVFEFARRYFHLNIAE